MKKQLTFLILLFFFLPVNSQNDTLYLKTDSLIYRGKIYNKMIDSNKSGDWIEYEIINNGSVTLVNWDGIDSIGNWIGGQYEIKTEYSANNSPNDESINESFLIHINYENKIPKDNYYISGKGKYYKNKKQGIWRYYYSNGQLLKTIEYNQSEPISNFTIFYKNGRKKINSNKIKNNLWNVSKYSNEGVLISIDTLDSKEIISLY